MFSHGASRCCAFVITPETESYKKNTHQDFDDIFVHESFILYYMTVYEAPTQSYFKEKRDEILTTLVSLKLSINQVKQCARIEYLGFGLPFTTF